MKKIVIISNPPSYTSDGMDQRIKEIDSLLRNKYNIEYLPGFESKYFVDIVKKLNSANIIYIHSLFNYIKIFPLAILFRRKIFLDVHGAIPDELKSEGRYLKSVLFGLVERFAMTTSAKIICVSYGMIDYYKKKYLSKRNVDSFLLLPVINFDESVDLIMQKKPDIPYTIIYAGGDQIWQNTELMKSIALKNADDFAFEFFLPADAAARFRSETLNSKPKIIIDSLSKSDLQLRYRDAHFGFLLRDTNIVNMVANPTKLAEYIKNGIIPIIIDPKMCDIDKLGYKFVLASDIKKIKTFDEEEYEKMRKENITIYRNYLLTARSEVLRFNEIIEQS